MTYPYEKMLNLEPATPSSDSDLDALAASMTTDEAKPIPAGYTYLGQFINHDISLELAAVGGDQVPSGGTIQIDQVANYRMPFLNLDSVYGIPGVTQNGFTPADLLDPNDNRLFKLGDTSSSPVGKLPPFTGKDLPRVPGQPKAILVEARNDENLAVAQTHLLFLRFHNAIVQHWLPANSVDPFEDARAEVIKHYQWIVLKDYLPRIVRKDVLDDVVKNPGRFYRAGATPSVPLEFSVAAFRMGHSMIRESYNWNRIFNHGPGHVPATLFDLRDFASLAQTMTVNQLPSEWAINWNWFYESSFIDQGQMVNMASPINTRLARSLGTPYVRRTSLAAADLFRGRAHGLPSGQAVAEVILGGVSDVLKPDQIEPLFSPSMPGNLRRAFAAETPLWFYLLAESEIRERGARLGKVGSRLVAETIVELIRSSTPSILPNGFEPNPHWRTGKGEFDMVQLLKVVAKGQLEELDPVGNIKI